MEEGYQIKSSLTLFLAGQKAQLFAGPLQRFVMFFFH
jgi:hypothetical protein